MSNGTESAAAFDYVYIHKYLSDLLLRKVWDAQARRDFIERYVSASTPTDSKKRAIVGIGIGEDQSNGHPRLEFLSTIEGEYLKIKELLSDHNWKGIPFHVIRTGRILACSQKAQGGDSLERGLAGHIWLRRRRQRRNLESIYP